MATKSVKTMSDPENKFTPQDTICAISTPPGIGGIAVIRLSGPQAIQIADSIWFSSDLDKAPSRKALFGLLGDSSGETIDECLVTIFRAPHSFTGEDTVEFSVHGSAFLQHHLLKTLVDKGARLAEPGEFTRRAFISGNIDLPKAEAIADIISSSSAASHRLAVNQLKGGLTKEIDTLYYSLLNLSSLLELELDFSEEDVEFASREKIKTLASEIIDNISGLASTFGAAQAIKEGVPVAIVGKPNAGKSTLLNRLLNDDRAIVSAIPGTTRDIIEGTAEINGTSFRFFDTAGLRESTDEIEKIGIKKALEKISKSRVILYLKPADEKPAAELDALIQNTVDKLPFRPAIINVITKTDIAQPLMPSDDNILNISALTGEGIDRLRMKIYAKAEVDSVAHADIAVTNIRHYQALCQAREQLGNLLEGIDSGLPVDLLAFHLHEGLEALATVTGRITSETILQNIFSRFCIGK